jgi:hypothetical protein
MSFCSTCKIHRADDAVFCPDCGQRLEISDTPKFDLREHLSQLQQHGWLRIKTRQDGDKTKPRRYKQERWNAVKYLEDIWRALVRGGFSYFTNIGKERQETFTTGTLLTTEHAVTTREKTPILLPQEQLQKVVDIRTKSLEGQLYYTGQRFLYEVNVLEMEMSRSSEVGKHFIFTKPLLSFWIKPDFSELLRLTNCTVLREIGKFRKKQYHDMTYCVREVKRPGFRQPKAVYCGYLWDGPDGQYVDDAAFSIFAAPSGDTSAETLADKLGNLIRQAVSTPVTELLAYTYRCHARHDALVATTADAGVRSMQEHPYAHWSTFPIIV